MALRASGRLSVTRATPASTSQRTTSPVTEASGSAGHDHAGAVAEESLVGGDADTSAFHLATVGLPAQLPDELADLGDGLGRDGLAEAGEPAARVDGDA